MLFGHTFVELVIIAVIIAAVIAILVIALRKFGITIPDWVVAMFWVVIVAMVAILCIKLIASML